MGSKDGIQIRYMEEWVEKCTAGREEGVMLIKILMSEFEGVYVMRMH